MKKLKFLTTSIAFALYSSCINTASVIAADNIQENYNSIKTGFSFQNISSYSTPVLYQLWSGKDSEFDEIEKEHIFQECLKRNDPMAKLVECEKLLAQKLTSRSLAKLVSIELPSLSQDCHQVGSSQASKPQTISAITEKKLVEGFKPIKNEEIPTIKAITKEALLDLLKEEGNEDSYKTYYKALPGFCGLTGLRPFLLFENQSILTPEQAKDMVIYWIQQFQQSKGTKKYLSSTDETLSFSDVYPTTSYWIEILKKDVFNNSNEPQLCVIVNRLLLKLDSINTSLFEADKVPFWKDNAWN